jgi:glycine cleavage system aminomethyltransferase T
MLDTLTRRAGAFVNGRAGVASHYGSPAGELAICVRAVGLVDRSDLVKLALTGPQDELVELVHGTSGHSLSPGGWVFAAGAYWCAASPELVLAIAEPRDPSLTEAVAGLDVPAGVDVADRSADWTALGLAGEHTIGVLAALGLVADPRRARPFLPATIAGARAGVLLQSDRRALVLARSSSAAEVWQAVSAAGRPFGLSYVGTEAQARFAVLDRMLERTADPPRA